MHLWPSLRIRDSFKQSYLDKIERNRQRMKQEKQQEKRGDPSPADPLLTNRDAKNCSSSDLPEAEPPSSRSKICSVLAFCSDLLLLFSCCCCCYCCGGTLMDSSLLRSFKYYSPVSEILAYSIPKTWLPNFQLYLQLPWALRIHLFMFVAVCEDVNEKRTVY